MTIRIERNDKEIEYRELKIKIIDKFIKDFNEEAKRQGSKWFAKMKDSYPHLSKNAFFYQDDFKITYYDGNFFFVDNDYMIGESTREANLNFFKYYGQFKPILKKIPQRFRILDNR